MLLMGLNIGLVLSAIVSFWIRHSVPGILAIACGAVGGVTLYSRVKFWKTGMARQLYDLVGDNEKEMKKMRNFDYYVLGYRGVQYDNFSLVPGPVKSRKHSARLMITPRESMPEGIDGD